MISPTATPAAITATPAAITAAPAALEPTNPFSSRFIRPGARHFLFPAGQSLPSVLARLRTQAWRGEIVGPHGSGKSTLLHALRTAFLEAGFETECFVLQADGKIPPALRGFQWRTNASILVVDGFEQLSWLQRTKLIRASRKKRHGLVVTSHRGIGLPRLFATRPTLETTQRVVAQMLQNGEAARIDQNDVARCFSRQQGDIRETLFELYDVYQQRLHSQPSKLAPVDSPYSDSIGFDELHDSQPSKLAPVDSPPPAV